MLCIVGALSHDSFMMQKLKAYGSARDDDDDVEATCLFGFHLTLAITWPQSELESNYHFGGGSGE